MYNLGVLALILITAGDFIPFFQIFSLMITGLRSQETCILSNVFFSQNLFSLSLLRCLLRFSHLCFTGI